MMLKISTKLTIWYSVSAAVIIFVIGFSMYITYESQQINSIDNAIEEFGETLLTGLPDEMDHLEHIFENFLLKKYTPTKKFRNYLFFLSSRDSVLFETNPSPFIDSLIDVVHERKKNIGKSYFNNFEFNGIEYRMYSVPVNIKLKSQSRTRKKLSSLSLIILYPLDRFHESLAQLRKLIFIISPLALIAASFIGWLIAKRAFKPIYTIAETASQISSQNLEKRVTLGKSDDELSFLAKTFNDMIGRLDATFKSHQRFIADTSHDLRTPLTIIQLELELLKKKKELPSDVIFSIDRSLREVIRLNMLTESLVFLAMADANQLTLNKHLIRLDEIIFDSISLFKNFAEQKRIRFNINIDDFYEIQADENLMTRVVNNLIDNAVKFSNDGGQITISFKQVDNFLILSISNSGKPIPSEHLDKIFNRFHKIEKSRTTEGFGLGLAIVKTIIELHGGSISVESNELNGTTFRISLPIESVVINV